MLNNTDTILRKLEALNLGSDEARIYLELLKEPATHLRLARATGINRTKVYRLADQLEKRSLISVRTDDRGTFLMASDPATLEIELVTQEEELKSRRQVFESLIPTLGLIQNNDTSSFIVHTYEGEEGFKQMLWHELKTSDENLMFGTGPLTELVENRHWVRQHQARMVEAGYRIRELVNPDDSNAVFTIDANHYRYRILPSAILTLQSQIAIYNNTIAIYHWRERQKVGLEIINQGVTTMMRQLFEHYWDAAESFHDSNAAREATTKAD